MVGDEVTSYRTFIKIPDEWRRQREEQSVARTIFTFLPVLLMLGFGGTVLVFFLREIKSDLMREVPWRRFSLWGLYGIVAYILIFAFADRIAQALSQYSTAMPLKVRIRRLGHRLSGGNVFLFGSDRAAICHGVVFSAPGVRRNGFSRLARNGEKLLSRCVADRSGRNGST